MRNVILRINLSNAHFVTDHLPETTLYDTMFAPIIRTKRWKHPEQREHVTIVVRGGLDVMDNFLVIGVFDWQRTALTKKHPDRNVAP